MANWKFYHDTRNKRRSDWPLKIKITHRGVPRYVLTGYSLTKEEWDRDAEKVVSPFKNIGKANSRLARMTAIAGEVLDAVGPMGGFTTADELRDTIQTRIDQEFKKVAKEYKELTFYGGNQNCFLRYAEKVEREFRADERDGSADTIMNAIDVLRRYSKRKTLYFEELTVEFLIQLEKWYLKQINNRGKKNGLNGLGVHLRAIRQVYKLALDDKTIKLKIESYPFGTGKYRIKSEKKENKSISSSDIAKIMNLPLTESTRLWNHQQYFIFAFDGWGANFKDLAFMRVSQVLDGRMKYRRIKTKWSQNSKAFDIELTSRQKRIVNHFAEGKKPTDLLFPIMQEATLQSNDSTEIHNTYKAKMKNHYRRLKTLMKRAGLPDYAPSGIYVVRHSFFQAALENGVHKDEIQEMANHSSPLVTEDYLKGFPSKHLNEQANRVRGIIPDAIGQSHLEMKPETDTSEAILQELLSIKKVPDQTVSVRDFLLEALPNAIEGGKVSRTKLITDILVQTNCSNGKVAANYVDAFLVA